MNESQYTPLGTRALKYAFFLLMLSVYVWIAGSA